MRSAEHAQQQLEHREMIEDDERETGWREYLIEMRSRDDDRDTVQIRKDWDAKQMRLF